MISRFPSLFFYQAFLYIAVFLSFEMLSFFANVSRIIPWITINYSWYEWNRFVSKKCLATFNFWRTSISQRALSLLMFIITCQANFRILHPLKKNDNFLISAILKTFFKFHALCHNLVFANASLSLFYHCIIKNNCSKLCQTSIKNKPPSANVKTAASHIYLLLFEQTNKILQHFIKFCGIK